MEPLESTMATAVAALKAREQLQAVWMGTLLRLGTASAKPLRLHWVEAHGIFAILEATPTDDERGIEAGSRRIATYYPPHTVKQYQPGRRKP